MSADWRQVFNRPVDRLAREVHGAGVSESYQLPRTIWAALWRGARCLCPRCGEAKLFAKWLKPVAVCATCQLDISGQRADDFPAYIALFATGHLLAPVIISITLGTTLGALAIMGIIIPLAVVMLLALLQPSKGAVIGLQWWNGMHGFRRERAAVPRDAD